MNIKSKNPAGAGGASEAVHAGALNVEKSTFELTKTQAFALRASIVLAAAPDVLMLAALVRGLVQ